ncbi:metal ABC transporter substrate-binding protein [Streptomyces sp. XM4193]|nr:metal ABC transporter substrate-binding protein [Streptomyces sp. XM4193]MCK1795911.1 metal ABC transporter substrate-binding protein [Streptomyces sp. XM4193]
MNARRRPLISATVAGATALGVLSLAACGEGGSGTTEDGRMSVVASFYPMQFLAERIGGDHVSVETLTEPGVEPHDLELNAKQTGRLSEAGMIVYLKGLQPAVDEAIDQSGAEHVVEATEHTELSESGDDHDHDHGDDHGDHEGHDHGDEDHDHGDEGGHEGHDHGPLDPHLWLDPVKYAEVAEGVGKAMAEADPDNADDYADNTSALAKELRTLDKEFSDGLKKTSTSTFITTHSAFGYLADRYGLDEESVAGLDPESEPSPARMKELHGIVRAEKVNTVFFEQIASDRTVKSLAGDLKLKTDVLDPVEGITKESRGKNYLEVMRANLAALQKALGAE